MSLIEPRVKQHLPYLRRFARSLSGSRSRGDALVADLLAEVADKESVILADLNPRIALYREFIAFCRHRSSREFLPTHVAIDRSIDSLTRFYCETSRIAMLLSAIEGFSKSDISEILKIHTSELDGIFDALKRRLSVKTGQKICIIEDEPMIAMQIRELITEMGYKVCSISRTERQAQADIEQNRPDLILCDVKLANQGSGVAAVKNCLEDRSVSVVFVTAFPETLLTGQGIEPTFLISKPFQPAMLQAVVNQALYFHAQAFAIEAA